MALVDANYKFTMVDIGAYGSESDRSVFNSSNIGRALANGSLAIPPCSKLPYSDIVLPKFIVADEAFPLKPYLMKPYPGRNTGLLPHDKVIYNYRYELLKYVSSIEPHVFIIYRISRARRLVENAFGILANRWRIFRKPIHATPETAELAIKACLVIHNFLGDKDKDYCPSNYRDDYDSSGRLIEGGWRAQAASNTSCLSNLRKTGGINYTNEAK